MKKIFIRSIISALFISIVFAVFTIGYIANIKSHIEDSVLRLHIIGASDSNLDQTLKLSVRDRILADFSSIFSECNSLSDSKLCAEDGLYKIKLAAEDELKKHGCTDKVEAEIKKCRFPTKVYGDVSLPSGVYTALNIKIGNAQGHNWWCVMYPPLCITENVVKLSDESKEKLKSTLSADEYRLITESDIGDVKIKFKLAEILGKYIK